MYLVVANVACLNDHKTQIILFVMYEMYGAASIKHDQLHHITKTLYSCYVLL